MAASSSASMSTAAPPSSTYSGEYDGCSSSESDSEVVSLLDRLKSPAPAAIAWSRKIRTNLPPCGKRTCRGALRCDPKRDYPAQRVREFPTESFTVSHSRLFCSACREQLSLKRSVVKNHIECMKHRNAKERLAKNGARERDIASCLKKFNQQEHQKGETLPEQQQVYRVKVVSTFLKAGVPLGKIQKFRELLEENATKLTDKHGMYDYLPFILSEEENRICTEIDGRHT